MSLSINRCTDPSAWDAFVAASPQGNIFCRTPFLVAQGAEYDLWFVEKNGQPQAGAVVMLGDSEPTMYQGLLFAGHSSAFQPHRRAKWTLEVIEALLTGLAERYDRLSFCLHYALEDLRGFQWFHYHEPDLGQFKMKLYYTGILDLASSLDFETYLTTIRKVRRYEYRRAFRDGLTVEVSKDIETLDHLHRLTFERQGLERGEEEHLLRSIIAAALDEGFGELLVCRTTNGEAASATLFLLDEHCGYYLFGANHPDFRNTGSGTLLMLENIRRCQERGLQKVDFVGINSPNRGDFKTSFNAVPMPYYVATWGKP